MAGIRTVSYTLLLGVAAITSGCVIREGGGREAREEGYREGYYDREHSRYYHEHAWHECGEHNEYCR